VEFGKVNRYIPFGMTILVILLTDLLVGVSIGLLISIYYIIQNNFKTEFLVSSIKKHEIEYISLKLNSNVTFLNKVQLRKTLDLIPEYSYLTIDGSESYFIDYDILEIISEYANKAHDRHIEIALGWNFKK
jgi:MFS superfamily sulfate permease-like transporter